MTRHAILPALLATALLAGCGGDGDGDKKSSTATPVSTIRIAGYAFAPTPATVKVGQAIAVPNADSAPHTLTEDGSSPSFDSGTIRGKKTGTVTFKKPGTFKYYCQFHATMKGTVTVVE